jgi:hypothetical protein
MGRRKKSRLTIGNVISAIIVLVILVVLYLPPIISVGSSLLQPRKVELSLIPSPYSYVLTHNDLQNYGIEMTGVSGYSANIYLSFQNEDVEIGEAVTFHIEIANLGNSLANPYFYVFLVNNTGNVVSTFPQWIGNVVSVSEFYKLSPWPVETQDGVDYLELNSYSTLITIPRQTLIAGQGDFWNNSVHEQNCEIWLQGQIADDSSQIGRWELWVFLCDETYQTSTGVPISSQNAIAYTTQFFNVVPKAPPSPVNSFASLWQGVSAAASFGFVVLAVFGLFKKLSPWIDGHIPDAQISSWWKRNQLIIVFSAVLLILYIVLFLLGARIPS